ncbi:nucleolar complex protein 4 homolog B isoform X2 [Drosophila biarmipes]|uniref:nucleolar complex protein 4 homolog B isoform X2 n=1 Tax=Drosophila biarmipes TaxID=125945 RepID=UPI0021CCD019|nr:nucleolar complex protein 4 homolog B isoform X2 [Drosophila biarmipes]
MKRLAAKKDEDIGEPLAKKQLQSKANALLNAKNVDIKTLKGFVQLLATPENVPAGEVINTLEVIFRNLLKRKPTEGSEKQTHKIHELYEETWLLLLENLLVNSESSGALKVCMQLIKVEAQHPLGPTKGWPIYRIRAIIETLLNAEETPTSALANYGKYCKNLDVLELTLKHLLQVVPKEDFKDIPVKAMNFLSILNLIDLGKSVLNTADYHVESAKSREFSLEQNQKRLNDLWKVIMARSSAVEEKLHRQILVVLLERVINHLKNPIQLTDFLMDSLHQFDGPIALLALQGIFTLMQKQNITYPDVYEKLYNMFYPRMFFNKYKARLFYLADIFLTSTHLPENLVAAFVKRLARLALQSPTEDAVIMIRFVCNLLLRHTGLQKLIRASNAADELSDPYNQTETDPVKSGAINSSLWEITLLQKHVVPEVANAARFINSSLPVMEFDLAPLLDRKECNIFDDELQAKAKQFAMNYERPANLALPKNAFVTKYWDLI